MKKGQQKGTQRVNWPVTILLILGSLTIFFPLYMAIVIAFKSPSEMTNDIAGILSLPSAFRLDNFTEAMRVTDFWHSLGNSLLITCTVILIAIAVHSLAGYAIGRNMAWLLKCIEAGKNAGVALPEQEEKIKTNYIR